MRVAGVLVLITPALAFAQPVPPDAPTPPPAAPPPAAPPGDTPPTHSEPPPVVAPQPQPPPQPAPAQTEIELKSGFAIELHLETSIVQIQQVTNMGTVTSQALTLPQPGIFFGYRGPGVTIGIAVDYSNGDQSQTQTGQTTNEATSTSYLIQPGIRVPILRSKDGRTEFLAQVDLGVGSISTHTTDPNPDPPSITHVRFQLAPSLRCWINSTFAVGATVGLRYDHFSQDNDVSQGFPEGSTISTTTGLFTSLQFTGVF